RWTARGEIAGYGARRDSIGVRFFQAFQSSLGVFERSIFPVRFFAYHLEIAFRFSSVALLLVNFSKGDQRIQIIAGLKGVDLFGKPDTELVVFARFIQVLFRFINLAEEECSIASAGGFVSHHPAIDPRENFLANRFRLCITS